MKKLAVVVLIAATPLMAKAVTFRGLVNDTIVPFVDEALLPFMYALAILFFLYGMFRYFFTPSEEAREKGKQHAIWGIIALVVLFGVWGFVRVLLSVIGA